MEEEETITKIEKEMERNIVPPVSDSKDTEDERNIASKGKFL